MYRLLVVSHHFAERFGGLQIAADHIARGLAQRDWKVVWIASRPPSGLCVDQAGDGASFRRIGVGAWNITDRVFGVPYPFWSPIGLARLCYEIGYADAVHMHDSLYLGNLVAYVAARSIGKPILITQHIDVLPLKSKVLTAINYAANRTLASALLGGCTQSVFYSHKVMSFFARYVQYSRPPAYIANGVATHVFCPVPLRARNELRLRHGWPANKRIALFVGRFIKRKNVGLLLELAKRFRDVHWVFVGYGPDDPLKSNLPNVERVSTIRHDSLATYYQAADILVLPSEGEGFPLVVQEAMACGLPVLISAETASAVRGVSSATFVSQLTSSALRDTLEHAISDIDVLRATGLRGLAFAREHWNWDTCISAYDTLLRKLIVHRARIERSQYTRSLDNV